MLQFQSLKDTYFNIPLIQLLIHIPIYFEVNAEPECEIFQSTSQPVEKSEEERLLEDIQNFVNDSISVRTAPNLFINQKNDSIFINLPFPFQRCDSPDEGVGEEADSEDEGADVDSTKNAGT